MFCGAFAFVKKLRQKCVLSFQAQQKTLSLEDQLSMANSVITYKRLEIQRVIYLFKSQLSRVVSIAIKSYVSTKYF